MMSVSKGVNEFLAPGGRGLERGGMNRTPPWCL